MTDESPPNGGALAKTSVTDRDADPIPEEGERMSRQEAMRVLGVSTTQLAARVSAGDLRSWRVGRDAIYERSEVEALAGRDGGGAILREARALLKQSHEHNEAAMRLLLDGARGFGEMSRGVIEKVLERNRKLEDELAAGRDAIQKAGAEEAQQAIAMMQAEAALEREKALVRAGERLVPVIMARLQQGTTAEDAAIAVAARSLAADEDLVRRMRQGLAPDQRLALDSLVHTLRRGAPPPSSPPAPPAGELPAGGGPGDSK